MNQPMQSISVPADPAPYQQIVLDAIRDLMGQLGNRPLTVSPFADFEQDLGLGSLERVELATRLEQRLSVRIPEALLAEALTPAGLADALARCCNESGQGLVSMRPARSQERSEGAPQVATLVELARLRAEQDGDRTHLIVLDGASERHLSFAELWDGACRVCTHLAHLNPEPGFRAVLLLPTGTDFFTTFVGVLMAGGVPVPIYPPSNLKDLPAYVERQTHLIESAQPRVILSDERLLPVAKLLEERGRSLVAITTEQLSRSDPAVQVAPVGPNDLALIQYSSGSTGSPKGVALSHRALLANMRAIGNALAFSHSDTVVSWLPLYHDMGLIGTWLSPFLYGLRVVMLPPMQFLSRPERWLWALHKYRGTLSPAPNFAYELCVRRVRKEDIEGLDLSSWRAAMNGSEPIRVETIERFCERFEPYGFERRAMMPVYGLAESCVALAFSQPGAGPRVDRIDPEQFFAEGRAQPSSDLKALTMVACGQPLRGHEIRIADADAADAPERVQGRILFRGPSSMTGYYARPDATAEVLCDGWIDSGDLGYLADGEVYVTGRRKDLIIKGGRKYHPQDIEEAAQSVDGIRRGCAVAFAVPGALGGDAIVVLAETSKQSDQERLRAAVTGAVQRRIGTPPDLVSLLRPGSLPKTSSGKLRRQECRRLYLASEFKDAPPPERVEADARPLQERPGASRRAPRSRSGAYATGMAAATLVPGLALIRAFSRSQETTWRACRLLLRTATALSGVPIRRTGPPIPSTRAVLVSNHSSYLDWLILTAALEQPFLFLAKDSVFELPLLGPIARRLGHIEVRRREFSGRTQGYEQIVDAASRGRLVHFFPESTFTPADGIRPFRLGAFQLAAQLDLPIVPVAICGARRVLRDGQRMLSPGEIEVRVLPALAPPKPDLAEIASTRDFVRGLLARSVGEPMLDIITAALPSEAEANA